MSLNINELDAFNELFIFCSYQQVGFSLVCEESCGTWYVSISSANKDENKIITKSRSEIKDCLRDLKEIFKNKGLLNE